MNLDPSNLPEGKDDYLAAEPGVEIELKLKGSRFLGQLFAAANESEARSQLDAVKRRHHDATHHCSAWRIGPPESAVQRSDDDGEPSGTAGRPILGALQREKLFDALVVVTRYFGGTKLGSGGLVRAYGEAAALAIATSRPRTVYLCSEIIVRCGYELSGVVETLLSKQGAALKSVERSFEEGPSYRLSMLRGRAPRLVAELIEATAGRAAVEMR